MRIAVFHNLPSGGAKRALFEWISRLSTTHEIDLYTMSEADHQFCDIRPFSSRQFLYNFVPNRLFASPFGRLNQFQYWRDLLGLERIGHWIAEEVNGGNYDVLFVNPCQRTHIPAFLQFVEINCVYYLHEPFGPLLQRKISRPYSRPNNTILASQRIDPLVRLYRRRLDMIRHKGMEKVSLLLANSAYTQQQMSFAYGIETHLCHLGVNTSDFRPMPEVVKERHLISVGELTPRKGFDFLIESLGHLPANKRLPLRLIANYIDPREMSYLEELAKSLDVDLGVISRLDTKQLAIQYNKAILCIYAPLAEPLGLVPLEAIACGTPVVGIAEGGVCETVQHGLTGLLVERNPFLFAAAIANLIEDDALRARVAAQGPKLVRQNWSWSESTRVLERYLVKAAMEMRN